MEIQKELSSISWQVDEPTYRADTALSYSTLARYEREGFDKLDHLFDKTESPSLLFGSCVDCLITADEDTFNREFAVLDIDITEGGMNVCKQLLSLDLPYSTFEEIPESIVSEAAKDSGFWKADKWDNKRYSEVLKTGNIADYYNVACHSDKTIVSSEMYQKVLACVKALKESPATSGYFAEDDELSSVRRYYQLKFKGVHNGVRYRCMMDLAVVDYEDKIIYPCDLKTSGHAEWHFEDSFTTWQYMIQARLYWRLLRANMNKDPFFKDFELADYKFIVVNKDTLTPLVWEFPLTKSFGTLIDEKGNVYRDPFEIGEELQGYLDLRPEVPNNIVKDGVNIIKCLKVEKETSR